MLASSAISVALLPSAWGDLPPAEQLALLINAYNALCISLIVRHVQSGAALKSIHELSSPKLKVWDRQAGVIGGREVTLNTISLSHSFSLSHH